jgi:ATP-dependent Clp protease adapter protein ClpS
MNWKALLILTLSAPFLVGLLYLPVRWWVGRKAKQGSPDSPARRQVTFAGFLLSAVTMGVITYGLSQRYLAPESDFGHFVGTGHGQLTFAAVVFCVSVVLEVILKKFGVSFVRRAEREQVLASATAANPTNTPGTAGSERKGYVRLLSVGGTPVFVHWSLPLGGLVISSMGGLDLHRAVFFAVGYALLIAFHEFGHAMAARLLGLKVLAVDISGAGGLCRTERPRSVRHTVIFFSAGLIVQLGLLLIAVLYLVVAGQPTARFGQCLVLTFTLVNVVLLVINLLPNKTSRGLDTDGLMLWKLFLHVTRNHPHPLPYPVAADKGPVFPPETRLLSIPKLVPRGFKVGIEILNDTTTPMDFVAATLMRHLQLEYQDAVTMMLNIHGNGGQLVPLPSMEKAESVAASISSEAKEKGFNFTCRAIDARQLVGGGP